MSLFEFLMIMLSIIIGLGISEILTGIARFTGPTLPGLFVPGYSAIHLCDQLKRHHSYG